MTKTRFEVPVSPQLKASIEARAKKDGISKQEAFKRLVKDAGVLSQAKEGSKH